MKPLFRKRLVGVIRGLSVYLVDGEYVRNTFEIDFTMGGTFARYPEFIPENEVWIDDGMSTLDVCATIVHELVERHRMLALGEGYDEAHDVASGVEIAFRREVKVHRRVSLPKINAWLRKWE